MPCHTGSMQVSLSRIPSGEAGTDATLRKIGQLVTESLRDPRIRIKAVHILESAGVPNADNVRAARALVNFVAENVRFVNDPVDLETVQEPAVTLFEFPAGDCDDHSAAVAALAMSIGIPARFRVIGNSSDQFEHIHPELHIAGQWIPVDTTTGTFGERQQLFFVEKIYDFKGAPMRRSLGNTAPRLINHNDAHQAIVAQVVGALAPGIKSGAVGKQAIRRQLQDLDHGRIPAAWKGTFVPNAVREGLQNALKIDQVRANIARRSGLGNLGALGFFGNIVAAVTSTAGKLLDSAGGGKVPGVNTGSGDTAEDGMKYGFEDSHWKGLLDWHRRAIREGSTLGGEGINPDFDPQPGTAYYKARISRAVGGDGVMRYNDPGITIVNGRPMKKEPDGTVREPVTTTQRIQAGATNVAGGLADMFSNPMVLALAGTVGYLALKKKKGR